MPSADCLGDVDPETFFAEVWCRRPAVLHGVPSWPEMTVDDFYVLASTHAGGDPAITLYDPAATTSSESSEVLRERLRAGELMADINRDFAIICRAIQRYVPELEGLRASWSHLVACKGNVNAYATWPDSVVFPPHHDAHHVVAYQLYGRKRWWLWPPVVESPMREFSWGAEPPQTDALVIETSPRQALYIPHGWVHRGKAIDGPSLHATVGLEPPRWVSLLRRELDRLASEHSLLRSTPAATYSSGRVCYEADSDWPTIVRWVAERLLDTSPVVGRTDHEAE